MKKVIISLGLMGTLLAGYAQAGEKEILASLTAIKLPTAGVKIAPSPIKGLNIVTTSQGIFYVSDDGQYITQGPIFDISKGTPKDISAATVLNLVKTVANDAIVYKADNEKYNIYVFSDVTCAYCKKLHQEMADINKQGITVHYLAFPRQGPDSQAGKDMQSIWSSADRKAAFDNGYKGNKVPEATSAIPYVTNQYQVGREIGITGTPTIVLPDGQVIAGYVPADKLKEILDQK